MDDGRLTHNSEVGGSNPPLYQFSVSQRPSSDREGLCVIGHVIKAGPGAPGQGPAGAKAGTERDSVGPFRRFCSPSLGFLIRRYHPVTSVPALPTGRGSIWISVSSGAITRRDPGPLPRAVYRSSRLRPGSGCPLKLKPGGTGNACRSLPLISHVPSVVSYWM